MNEFDQIEQTPDEKIAAVKKLKNNIQDEFLQIGQLLSEMKRSKLYKYKGFATFNDFLAESLNFVLGSKILTIYELFINDLEQDGKLIEEIGFDKLNILKPIIKLIGEDEVENWLETAKDSNINDLKEDVRDWKERNGKKKEITFKDILTSQFSSQMTSFFDCNKSDLDFKLALYFQDRDAEWFREVKETVRKREQRFFEENIGSVSEVDKEELLFEFAQSNNPFKKYDLSYQRLIKAGFSIIVEGEEEGVLYCFNSESPNGAFYLPEPGIRIEEELSKKEDLLLLIYREVDGDFALNNKLSIDRITAKGFTILFAKDLSILEIHEGETKFQELTTCESIGQTEYALDGYLANENNIMRFLKLPDVDHLYETEKTIENLTEPMVEISEPKEPEVKTA